MLSSGASITQAWQLPVPAGSTSSSGHCGRRAPGCDGGEAAHWVPALLSRSISQKLLCHSRGCSQWSFLASTLGTALSKEWGQELPWRCWGASLGRLKLLQSHKGPRCRESLSMLTLSHVDQVTVESCRDQGRRELLEVPLEGLCQRLGIVQVHVHSRGVCRDETQWETLVCGAAPLAWCL